MGYEYISFLQKPSLLQEGDFQIQIMRSGHRNVNKFQSVNIPRALQLKFGTPTKKLWTKFDCETYNT